MLKMLPMKQARRLSWQDVLLCLKEIRKQTNKKATKNTPSKQPTKQKQTKTCNK